MWGSPLCLWKLRFSVDGAVVVEAAFVAVEGVVVLGEDMRVVLGGHLYGCGNFSFC